MKREIKILVTWIFILGFTFLQGFGNPLFWIASLVALLFIVGIIFKIKNYNLKLFYNIILFALMFQGLIFVYTYLFRAIYLQDLIFKVMFVVLFVLFTISIIIYFYPYYKGDYPELF
jgi:hypothetical protein